MVDTDPGTKVNNIQLLYYFSQIFNHPKGLAKKSPIVSLTRFTIFAVAEYRILWGISYST